MCNDTKLVLSRKYLDKQKCYTQMTKFVLFYLSVLLCPGHMCTQNTVVGIKNMIRRLNTYILNPFK